MIPTLLLFDDPPLLVVTSISCIKNNTSMFVSLNRYLYFGDNEIYRIFGCQYPLLLFCHQFPRTVLDKGGALITLSSSKF